MNIPCRYLYGHDAWYPGGTWTHAWCEVYVSGGWHYCDPTWNLFDAPWSYVLYGVTMDLLKIYSYGDEELVQSGICDGADYNGKLDYSHDWMHIVLYDGPNGY